MHPGAYLQYHSLQRSDWEWWYTGGGNSNSSPAQFDPLSITHTPAYIYNGTNCHTDA